MICLALAFSRVAFAHEFGPEAARAALTNFAVANGLEISLFASEPMIRNPTSMDIDERGRVWITEGVNYRSTFQPWGVLQPAGDRVVILEDTSGDGVADKATTFYQGTDINSALGVCVLGNRVIVSCSPNVFIFTDTNGDGKADKKELLFTGIGGVDHDHGIHQFSFGPDGKLYFNFGNIGDQLKDKNGRPIIDLAGNEVNNHGKPYRNGMVFRCNLDGSDVEVLAYNFRNAYTVAVDSFGTLWQADNDDDGNRSVRLNYVMEYGNFGFGDELTGAGWTQPRANMEPDIPSRHWHQNDPGVVPNLLITGFGAPTGILIYEGDLLPAALRNQMIVADAGTRLIRSYPVQPDGAGYRTEPVDLLSTPDTWFRPSAIRVAPDGSLYIADWNDAGVGGHNMADRDVKTMTGRIYRLAPKGAKPVVPKLNLKTAAGCVKALQSPNLSTRYCAWSALQAMPGHGTRELEKLWRNRRAEPRMRARALYLLAQEKTKTRQFVAQALRESNPDLRITGLRIAVENKLDVIPFVRELADDPSPQVRRECAIALRHNNSPEAPQLWLELVQKYDGSDRWYLEALGIGADRQEDKFFDAWLAAVGTNWNTPAGRDIIWRSRAKKSADLLAKLILQPDTTNIYHYFRAFDYIKGPEKRDALISLVRAGGANATGVQRHMAFEALDRLDVSDLKANADLQDALQQMLQSVPTADFVRLVQNFHLRGQDDRLLKAALEQPGGESGIEAARAILASGNSALLENVLHQTNNAPKIIEALGNTRDKEAVPLLLPLVTNPDVDSATRRQAVHQLSHIQQGAAELLQLAKKDELPDDVKFVATMDLNRVPWTEQRIQAAKLLPMPQGRNAETLPPVKELLQRQGDVARGAKVFTRADVGCINCHRVNGEGKDLGPALSEIGAKLGKDALYEAILDPSAGIEFGYEAWHVQLKSGDDAVGIITSETDDEIVLKDARAIATHIKKSDIARREKLKISLMPAGLQQTMSAQDLVDLVEYLSSLKKAR
ncbi:MAG TPA: PVC-type heme-binding CxxCH protein [Verrucomicrobiae bacterium]|nr:PVC-type heme-binding CxxCH protein [Verrucomicrobiae bacterium]